MDISILVLYCSNNKFWYKHSDNYLHFGVSVQNRFRKNINI